MLDKNWPRWMRASIIKYFTDFIQEENNLHVYIETTEHIDKDGNYVTELQQFCEARFNGPITKQITLNSFDHTIIVNFLISTKLSNDNVYTHDDNVGIVYSAFINSIPVYKLGNGDEPIGCFQLETDRRDSIQVSHFGQIDTDVKITQSTIEAHYVLHLDL